MTIHLFLSIGTVFWLVAVLGYHIKIKEGYELTTGDKIFIAGGFAYGLYRWMEILG